MLNLDRDLPLNPHFLELTIMIKSKIKKKFLNAVA